MTAPVIVETPDGPIPLPVAIPQEAPPLHIPRLGDLYTWEDVGNWASSAWHGITDVFDAATSFPKDLVQSMIDASISTMVTTFSGFVNLSIDYTATAAKDLYDLTDTAIGYFLTETNVLQDQITWALGLITAIDTVVVPGILDDIRGLEGRVITGIEGAVVGVEAWAIDNIYHPLLRDLDALRRDIVVGIDSVVDGLRTEIDRAVHSEALRRAAALAALAATVAGINTWIKECGDPMCQAMGPKTDLGKALTALKGLLGLLAGVELAQLTEHDLERIAHAFTAITSGSLEQFFASFVEGGGTLGGAGGAVLGELTDAGRETLHVLGVPGM